MANSETVLGFSGLKRCSTLNISSGCIFFSLTLNSGHRAEKSSKVFTSFPFCLQNHSDVFCCVFKRSSKMFPMLHCFTVHLPVAATGPVLYYRFFFLSLQKQNVECCFLMTVTPPACTKALLPASVAPETPAATFASCGILVTTRMRRCFGNK